MYLFCVLCCAFLYSSCVSGLSALSDTASTLEKFRRNPPFPLNYTHMHPRSAYYLLGNIYALLSEIVKEPSVDPLAASTLFFAPPVGDNAMGSILSHYIEARLCAQKAELHFVTINSSFKGLGNTVDSGEASHLESIYSYFDHVIYNPHAVFPSSANNAQRECSCTFRCHESNSALVSQEGNGQLAHSILYPAFEKRSQEMKRRNITFANMSASHIWSAQLRHSAQNLAEIPQVAIQYRCSDNTLPGYGLLAWRAFLNHIPHTATSIYVMTENPHRRANENIVETCSAIIEELSQYLYFHFPAASVVVLRGGRALDDATRLAMAEITICSASTFCLWPAMASKTASYFPVSKLIYSNKATLQYTPAFHWLTDHTEMIFPLTLAEAESTPDKLIRMLKRGHMRSFLSDSPPKTRPYAPPAKEVVQKSKPHEANKDASAVSTQFRQQTRVEFQNTERYVTTERRPPSNTLWVAIVFFILAGLFFCRRKWY